MGISLILSFSTCFIFTIAGLFVWWQAVNKSGEDKQLKLFGWSWFFASGVVGFMGLRTMLFGLGFIIWDLTFALVDQFFLIGFFIAASYYILVKIIGEKKAKLIIYYFVLPLSLLIILFIFLYMADIASKTSGVDLTIVREEILKQRHTSDWGSEFVPPQMAINIFIFLLSCLLLLLSFDFFRELYNKVKNKLSDNSYNALLTLSLIIFLVALVFDQRGVDAGWKLLLYRIAGMFAALLAYVACSGKFNKNLL